MDVSWGGICGTDLHEWTSGRESVIAELSNTKLIIVHVEFFFYDSGG
jgi:threonine dehydrogenase-like Zn-dependent dehydrogenase